MLGRRHIAGCVAAGLLLLAPAFSQSYHSPQNQYLAQNQNQGQRAPGGNSSGSNPNSQNSYPRYAQPPNRPGHAGAWLRRYKDMPPAEQRRALESDPQFRRLSPPRQRQLLLRLQRFSALPPQQQERVLERMETWEHLSPGQKQEARTLFRQFQELRPDRRRALNDAIRGMRGLTPEQRDRMINSDDFARRFTPYERNLLSSAARLPLAGGLQ